MNPLNTFEKAKEWADSRADFFSSDIILVSFVVCNWNGGYIVHNIKHIYNHLKEYSGDEIVYCTNENDLKTLLIFLRFLK